MTAVLRRSVTWWAMLLSACFCSRQPLVAAPPDKKGAPEAQWIWSPAHMKDRVPEATCFFRKTFEAPNLTAAVVEITCDDRYELFVNGQSAGADANWRLLKSYDVAKLIEPGQNTIAVKAMNTEGATGALVARIKLTTTTGAEVTLVSDASWKSSLKEASGWQKAEFDDAQWVPSREYGPFGPTEPWANQVAGDHGEEGRFLLGADFRVEQVISPEESGSLIAMAFNEWGEILASREGGPLLLIVDRDHDGLVETVTTYCDQVKSCQGVLALNGQVFAVGEGPQGQGFYRLADDDQDGTAENVTLLFEFKVTVGEHGPHAPVLGPDGLIYLVIGNHAGVKQSYESNSPHHHYYEGDLVQPRYEDPNGHAAGVKAPGGVVLRTNIDGSFVQLFAGGLRNPYDIAFNREGDLFTYDADMEWDAGLPWYRPTRINHVTAGAEFGWRSGWAKWPEYYVDSLGAVINTERGSPAGIEFYNHYQYPARYHNALFACDWSQGRILAIRMTPAEGTYTAQSEVFLEGRPLNATDLAVGPEGWLYFSTGGRGTEGGIYRVVWTGKIPPRPKQKGVLEAIRQPQLQSAWARQEVATLQQSLGQQWDRQLAGVAEATNFSLADRLRALDLMQLVGPFPTTKLLVSLSKDREADMRAKAAYLMGIHTDAATQARLKELLGDAHPRVRRVACESLVRGAYQPPADRLVPLLADPSRAVAWAAGRALQRLPLEEWANDVIDATKMRVFLSGAPMIMAMEPPDAMLDAVLTRASDLIRESAGPTANGYLSDPDFVAVLRILQLGLERGKLTRDNVPELARQLADEYPANEPPDREQRINRELIRLLAYLQEESVIPRMLAALKSNMPLAEKVHLAGHLRAIRKGWTTEQKLELIEFYEQSYAADGGHSFGGYIDNFAKDFVAGFSDDERAEMLAHATRWPHTAIWALASLPEHPGDNLLTQLVELDERLLEEQSDAAVRLGTGVVAVLARSGDPVAMAHLRRQYDQHPDRREDLAMGLAQAPDGENWPVLLKSLAIVEGVAAQEVLSQLAKVDQSPDSPEPVRQVILCGLKLGDGGAPLSLKLLKKWTGEDVAGSGESWQTALAAWQSWFEEKYPDEPPPRLPEQTADTHWNYDELLGFINGADGPKGDAARGAAVFQKAQCVKCHRYGNRGESVGPDLSSVGQRFQRKEILESIVFPSQVISDQYASKNVVTTGGLTYTGLVAPSGDEAVTVLQSSGEKITVRKEEIDEIQPSKKSAMPEGLLDQLSLDEIADLFAYLGNPAKTAKMTVQQPKTRR